MTAICITELQKKCFHTTSVRHSTAKAQPLRRKHETCGQTYTKIEKSVARLPRPDLWSQNRQPLIWNASGRTLIGRQWLSSDHVTAATDNLLEAVFSVRSMHGLYAEQPPVWVGAGVRRPRAAGMRAQEQDTKTKHTRLFVTSLYIEFRSKVSVKASNKSNYQSKPIYSQSIAW